MKVPSPLTPQDPWSPLGYTIVEIGEDRTPAPKVNLDSSQLDSKKKTAEFTPVPWSPVGCRVVQVGEEKIEMPPSVIRAKPQNATRTLTGKSKYSKRKSGPPLPAIFLAAGGFFLMMLMCGMSAISLMSAPNRPMAVSLTDVPADLVNLAHQRKIMLPDYAANLPVREPAKPKEGGDLDCKNGCPLGEKQNFGTSVEFVRNPQEAGQIAKKAGKLTFLLHVSGDFEESRFT